jgi:hypothetical protein
LLLEVDSFEVHTTGCGFREATFPFETHIGSEKSGLTQGSPIDLTLR